MVDEDAPHRLGGDREEVRAVLVPGPVLIDEAQIGLVDERGRLQRVFRPLFGQVFLCDAPEIRVDQGKEPVDRSLRPARQFLEDLGRIALACHRAPPIQDPILPDSRFSCPFTPRFVAFLSDGPQLSRR